MSRRGFILFLFICLFVPSLTQAQTGGIPSTLGWYEIPNTKLQSVCPPNGFGGSGYAFTDNCWGVIEAWNSAAMDTARNRLIIWGGGHSDYSGNEIYTLDLNSLTITRLTNPGVPVASACPESVVSGTQPNSRHTYDGIEYMPNVDRLWIFGGSLATCGGSAHDTWTFNFATTKWEAKNPTGAIPRADFGIVSAYDPNTGKVFVHDSLDLYTYDFNTNSYQRLTNNGTGIDYHMTAATDPKRKKFVIIGGGGANGGGVVVYDISSGSSYTRQRPSTLGGAGIVNTDSPGLAYDPVSDRMVAWDGGNTVYSLNLDTNTWTTVSHSGGPAAPPAGTFGRWQYSPVSNVFVTINDANLNAHTFRLNNSSSPNPPPPTAVLSANPTSVVSGSASTLTWSSTNATSCSGSGAWSGTKAISGSQSSGNLTANTTFTLTCSGTGGSASQSATVAVTSSTPPTSPTPPPPPPSSPPSTTPSGAVSGYTMPSLQNEKDTYISWGWTWTANKEPGAVTEPIANYAVSNPDIHGDTEGDDLWTYLMMYRRTGNTVYLNRANAWARYFKNDYRNCVGSPSENFCYDRDAFGLDHFYGWGLIALYEHNGDAAALAEAENLAATLETMYGPATPFGCLPAGACIWYGPRAGARHLLFMTRLAQVTGKGRWITLRDKIVNLWLTSQNWDVTYSTYFLGDYVTDEVGGAGAYNQGLRVQSAFQLGILSEAFDHAYRATGNQELKNRMIAMARFVDRYGLDPTYQYTASYWGVKNGQPWHNYSATQPVTFWDPVYTTSLVNVLVRGYKYTGDINLYNRAKQFFNRGTKGIYGSTTQRQAADNVVGHFVDSIFATSTANFYLDYNKGELQYTYLIFENGGFPTVEAGTSPLSAPIAPSGLTVK